MKNENKKITVLFVDDEEGVRRLFRRVFQENDFQFFEAGDAMTGLDILKEEKVDIIVSDIIMADMDGYEFFNKVRGNPETDNIPFIFLSTKKSDKDKIYGLNVGADDYIAKPVSPFEVLARVNNIVNRLNRLNNPSLIPADLSGKLKEDGVSQIIQFLSHGRRSGKLTVTCDSDFGEAWFSEGELLTARTKNNEKENAIFEMMTFGEGIFQFEERVSLPKKNVQTNIVHIIMEGLRLIDERLSKEKTNIRNLAAKAKQEIQALENEADYLDEKMNDRLLDLLPEKEMKEIDSIAASKRITAKLQEIFDTIQKLQLKANSKKKELKKLCQADLVDIDFIINYISKSKTVNELKSEYKEACKLFNKKRWYQTHNKCLALANNTLNNYLKKPYVNAANREYDIELFTTISSLIGRGVTCRKMSRLDMDKFVSNLNSSSIDNYSIAFAGEPKLLLKFFNLISKENYSVSNSSTNTDLDFLLVARIPLSRHCVFYILGLPVVQGSLTNLKYVSVSDCLGILTDFASENTSYEKEVVLKAMQITSVSRIKFLNCNKDRKRIESSPVFDLIWNEITNFRCFGKDDLVFVVDSIVKELGNK